MIDNILDELSYERSKDNLEQKAGEVGFQSFTMGLGDEQIGNSSSPLKFLQEETKLPDKFYESGSEANNNYKLDDLDHAATLRLNEPGLSL